MKCKIKETGEIKELTLQYPNDPQEMAGEIIDAYQRAFARIKAEFTPQ